MKNIFIINGSAGNKSSNERLIAYIIDLAKDHFHFIMAGDLKTLPHFDPELSVENTPAGIINFRKHIEEADAVLICTPEYVFSIPSGLKNAIEWCVSTTVFSDKPTGLIVASAQGEKGFEELQLIMRTLMADFTEETILLIRGIKGKIDMKGNVTDELTKAQLKKFVEAMVQQSTTQ